MTLSPPPEWWGRAKPEIDKAVSEFAGRLRTKLETIPPGELIGRKNPYLFRARAPVDADQLAGRVIDAFLSSSEETQFGAILENIAIAVCGAAKGGWKSSASGIDLEYDEDAQRTIVQVKSSPAWGNSSQRAKMVDYFRGAKRILRQGGQVQSVRSVEGICYGSSGRKEYDHHVQLVGNEFWCEISGWPDTGKAVFDLVGQHAANGMSDLLEGTRASVVDYLERSGAAKDGEINWDGLYDLIMTPKRARSQRKLVLPT